MKTIGKMKEIQTARKLLRALTIKWALSDEDIKVLPHSIFYGGRWIGGGVHDSFVRNIIANDLRELQDYQTSESNEPLCVNWQEIINRLVNLGFLPPEHRT